MFFSTDEQHAPLYCPETMKLAKLHWYLLKSETLMESLCCEAVELPSSSGGMKLHSYRRTDFGQEVGRDEIDWWINRKEDNIDHFCQQSTRALDAAQVLKKAAGKLKEIDPGSYEELLIALRQFAEMYSEQIDVLHEYVKWLYGRDKLAPDILFTYKVWGSTRRGDRTIKVSGTAEGPDEEDKATLNRLLEIALGVSDSWQRKVDREYMEVGYEIFEETAGNPEAADVEIVIPVGRVLRRATRKITDECETYFTFLRDSLRDVLNEIGKREDREKLIKSDAFWRSFVSKVIASGRVEGQLWDFKETLTMWHAPKEERLRAKVRFAERLASFANADGGCLIIGVSNGREVLGIANEAREQENRIKTACDALAEHIQYPRQIYHLQPVAVKDNSGVEKLCLIIAVARACEPVGVNDGEGRYSYPVRRGTGTEKGDPDALRESRIHDKNDLFDFLADLRQFVRDN